MEGMFYAEIPKMWQPMWSLQSTTQKQTD